MKLQGVQNVTFDENPHENERIVVILGCANSIIACAKHRCTGGWLKLWPHPCRSSVSPPLVQITSLGTETTGKQSKIYARWGPDNETHFMKQIWWKIIQTWNTFIASITSWLRPVTTMLQLLTYWIIWKNYKRYTVKCRYNTVFGVQEIDRVIAVTAL